VDQLDPPKYRTVEKRVEERHAENKQRFKRWRMFMQIEEISSPLIHPLEESQEMPTAPEVLSLNNGPEEGREEEDAQDHSRPPSDDEDPSEKEDDDYKDVYGRPGHPSDDEDLCENEEEETPTEEALTERTMDHIINITSSSTDDEEKLTDETSTYDLVTPPTGAYRRTDLNHNQEAEEEDATSQITDRMNGIKSSTIERNQEGDSADESERTNLNHSRKMHFSSTGSAVAICGPLDRSEGQLPENTTTAQAIVIGVPIYLSGKLSGV
jgi:hypothetical protein